jgi:hypothetical protein
MSIRILTASILALGLFAPIGAMAAETNYNCSEEQRNKRDYIDCDVSDSNTTVKYGFAAQDFDNKKAGPTGDFIDETAEESNQRSTNR